MEGVAEIGYLKPELDAAKKSALPAQIAAFLKAIQGHKWETVYLVNIRPIYANV